MAMRSAAHRVFHVPELLEQILLGLEDTPYTLIGCMRVCKTFNETIAGSTLLQQALFLKPSPDPDEELLDDENWLLKTKRLAKNLPRGSSIRVYDIAGPSTSAMVRLMFACWSTNSRSCHAEASWRRMYLRKGNFTVKKIEVYGCGCTSGNKATGQWVNPTMGELVDAVGL